MTKLRRLVLFWASIMALLLCAKALIAIQPQQEAEIDGQGQFE